MPAAAFTSLCRDRLGFEQSIDRVASCFVAATGGIACLHPRTRDPIPAPTRRRLGGVLRAVQFDRIIPDQAPDAKLLAPFPPSVAGVPSQPAMDPAWPGRKPGQTAPPGLMAPFLMKPQKEGHASREERGQRIHRKMARQQRHTRPVSKRLHALYRSSPLLAAPSPSPFSGSGVRELTGAHPAGRRTQEGIRSLLRDLRRA